MKITALIPARSGSQRVKNKNIRLLGTQPLFEYTAKVAKKFDRFVDIVFCTDDSHYAELARSVGLTVPYIRSKKTAGSTSPDIRWVEEYLEYERKAKIHSDALCILRPTSPFRTVGMLERAYNMFTQNMHYDSLRAVSPVSEHPGKMWRNLGGQLFPILPYEIDNVPFHSNQNSKLPEVYVQNASLEMVWTKTVKNTNTISGNKIQSFVTNDFEGFDINTEIDFKLAEILLKDDQVHIDDVLP